MADVTTEELRDEIAKILKNVKLCDITSKQIIQQLEKKFKTNLNDRKKLLNKIIMDHVESIDSESEKEPDSDDEKKSKAKEESEDSDEPRPKRRRAAQPKPKAKPKAKKAGGGAGRGYTRAYKLSPALSELMGAEEMPRHEVVKRVWALIKEKQLYDPNNKQFAICDPALYSVIGTQRFRIFGMMKYLKTHFLDD